VRLALLGWYSGLLAWLEIFSWLSLRLGVVVVERYQFSDKLEEIMDRCLIIMFDNNV
jgi:hypothetical protein